VQASVTTRDVAVAPPLRLPRAQPTARPAALLDRLPAALVYPVLLAFLVYPYGDFDWGWHYRYGEYLWTHGRILRHDIFSWTMAGYEWVNHSWLFDPLLYALFNATSFWGLSLAAALIGLAAFHLGIRRAGLPLVPTALLALGFTALTREALLQGLRTQVVALLLFGILMDVLLAARTDARRYWVLPPLFALWANLHGSFPLGLGLVAVFVVCDFVIPQVMPGRGRRPPRALPAALALSVAATLLNPFTYRVYEEAVRHFSNPMLTKVIEWRRPEHAGLQGIVMALYTALLAWGVYARGRRRFDPALFAAGLVVLALALRTSRHGPVFAVVTLPLAALALKDAVAAWRPLRWKAGAAVLGLVVIVAAAATPAKMVQWRLVQESSFAAYATWGTCPEGLAAFLERHPPRGRGFNFYDWGGFLIGRGVQSPLFIDGRMHLWERPRDRYRPMADYDLIYYAGDEERFEYYRFDWVIVPRVSPLAQRLFAQPGVWRAAYADPLAAYFVRID
jgi:hypothetical protein